PVGRYEPAREVGRGHHSANRMRTRRFCLPLFSILLTASRPTSAVERTCVPPHGWTSTSPMRTSRTRPLPIGGLTFIVFTRPGVARLATAGGIEHGAIKNDPVLVVDRHHLRLGLAQVRVVAEEELGHRARS